MPVESSSPHVIILIHGIRDFALWQEGVRTALEECGFKVESTNYGRVNLLEFLIPIRYFRRKAARQVWNQIRIIKQNNAEAQLSVIAHSFGTYVIAHLMRRNFDIKFHHVILCGSVLSYDFPFEQFQNRFTAPIINEVGTRDIWPAMAESVTVGYGSAGTYGFHRPLVRDRWHNGAHHGFFLDAEFCKCFWAPFLRDGTLIAGATTPEATRLWLRLLSVFKIKYILVAVAIFTAALVIMLSSLPARGYIGCFIDRGDMYGKGGGRDLDGHISQEDNLTAGQCIGMCRTLGFKYAGLQFGNYCFCGQTYGRYGASSDCNNPCRGNPKEICGGYWANSVYGTRK